MSDRLPVVAILGRPNVGKSTLFNRLVGSRRAITHSAPGVTRDLVEGRASIGERQVLLVDTGGIGHGATGIEAVVRERALEAADAANVSLLLMDVTELTPEDMELAELMRRHADRTVLVVNKVDNPRREDMVWEFHELGFARVVPVAAVSGWNVSELEACVSEMLGASAAAVVEDTSDAIRLAVLGKPNTGKSTLVNRLLGSERAIVTDVPGTTRDVLEGRFVHEGREFLVLDTAGIRKKGKVRDSVEYFSVNRAIRSIRECDVVVLMIDGLDSVSEQDKKIAALVVREGKGVVLALNKWDTLRKTPNMLNAIRDRVRFVFPLLSFAPVMPLSALTGFGVRNLISTTVRMWEQLHTRVPTAELNKALQRWLEQYTIPSRGRNARIRYITQVREAPVRFVCFANSKRRIPEGYVRYLENRLREEFGFTDIPLSLEVREGTR